jgi:hypothetical protein
VKKGKSRSLIFPTHGGNVIVMRSLDNASLRRR